MWVLVLMFCIICVEPSGSYASHHRNDNLCVVLLELPFINEAWECIPKLEICM
jgi:hypothetical protein